MQVRKFWICQLGSRRYTIFEILVARPRIEPRSASKELIHFTTTAPNEFLHVYFNYNSSTCTNVKPFITTIGAVDTRFESLSYMCTDIATIWTQSPNIQVYMLFDTVARYPCTYCVEPVVDEMFEILTHANLPHQLVLISVHPRQLSNMGKDVLQPVGQL